MPDLAELLQESAQAPARPVDAPAVVQQAGVRLRRRRAVVAAAAAMVVVAGSAMAVDRLQRPTEVAFTPSSEPSSQGSTHLPDHLRQALAPHVLIEDGSFEDGALTVEETLAAFQREYTEPIDSLFDHQPTVYAVRATSSTSPILKDEPIRVVYIPHVPTYPRVPRQLPGEPPPTNGPVDTHFFAFFDARTGAYLMNMYIGSEQQP